MPDVPIREDGKIVGWLLYCEEHKPGDNPPSGYSEWHEWAEVQHRAGLRQVQCDRCMKWKFPQEIAETKLVQRVAYRTKQDAMAGENAITESVSVETCLACAEST